jgi:hypothetical protein
MLKTDLQTFLTAFDTRFRGLLWLSSLAGNIWIYKFFFMISNSSADPVNFCMTSPWVLSTQQYYIKSQWTYDQQTLWLEAMYKQPIPDFLLNGYANF